jgi:hypothetical protein
MARRLHSAAPGAEAPIRLEEKTTMNLRRLAPVLMLSACAMDPDTGSLDLAAGSGPIDQQQPNHPFVSGGLTCTPSFPGGLVQGVTPAASSWEVISLFMFNSADAPVDQPVELEVRSGAYDGPVIASMTAVVPDRMGDWIDYVFSPPLDLTPGSPVFLYAEVDHRVAWATDRTTADPYPAGTAHGLCGGFAFELDGDFTFITYEPAAADPDSDGDGLPDAEDPSTVADAADALPDSSYHAPGHRSAIDAKLADAEAAILAGDNEQARTILTQLRRHLDGCESGAAADRNDWITDCGDQDLIRALIDDILASL